MPGPLPPHIACPTTCGTGQRVHRDRRLRLPSRSARRPASPRAASGRRYALVDPDLHAHAPGDGRRRERLRRALPRARVVHRARRTRARPRPDVAVRAADEPGAQPVERLGSREALAPRAAASSCAPSRDARDVEARERADRGRRRWRASRSATPACTCRTRCPTRSPAWSDLAGRYRCRAIPTVEPLVPHGHVGRRQRAERLPRASRERARSATSKPRARSAPTPAARSPPTPARSSPTSWSRLMRATDASQRPWRRRLRRRRPRRAGPRRVRPEAARRQRASPRRRSIACAALLAVRCGTGNAERRRPIARPRLSAPAAHPHALDGQRRLRPRQQRRLLRVLRHRHQPLPHRRGRARHRTAAPSSACASSRAAPTCAPLAFPDALEAGLARGAPRPLERPLRDRPSSPPSDDAAAAQGEFVHVFVDRVTRRPVDLPPHLRDALARLYRAPAGK